MKLNNLTVSSALDIAGQSGVFSKESFNSGDIVLSLTGQTLSEPTRTSIKVGESQHVDDTIGNFINHNCNPTCKIENKRVIAIKNIKDGDEITFDYSENEDKLASPFICSCCNKLIS